MSVVRTIVVPCGVLLAISLVLMNYEDPGLLPGQLALAAWFVVPNLVYFSGTRPVTGAPAWMPGLILMVLQTWMVVDFWRFPQSTAPLILLAGPAYLLVLLGLYLGFLWVFRKRKTLMAGQGEE
ncbi:MAG: hypothetical protein OEV30_06555 [Ignavibacteria bacterium]|nr:hypothetical protein [Ignavibacteria bacterium]